MITVELRRLARDGSIIFLVLLSLAAAILLADKDDELVPAMELFLLLYASFTGWSVFDRERQEGAMEYLLSLPVSRTRLLLLKMLPRVACAALVFLLYSLAHDTFDYPSFLEPSALLVFYVIFFLVGFSLSVSLTNYVSALFVIAFLSVGMPFLIGVFDATKTEFAAAVQGNLPFLLFPILFFALFRTYDMHPLASFNLKYAPLLLAVTLGMAAVHYATRSTVYRCHALMPDGGIVRVGCDDCRETVLVEPDGTTFSLRGCVHPIAVLNGKLYADFGRKNKEGPKLVIADFRKGTTEVIYSCRPGWYLAVYIVGKAGIVRNGKLYILAADKTMASAAILEVDGTRVREIPVRGPLPSSKYALLVAVADPPQFIIHSDSRAFLVLPSGETRELFTVDSASSWKNRLLVFDQTGMTLYDIGAGMKAVYRMEGRVHEVKRRFSGPVQRKILFKNGDDAYLFDLEKDAPEKLDIDMRPFDYFEAGGRFLLIETLGAGEIGIKELKDGVLVGIGVWKHGLENPRIVAFPNGILVIDIRKGDYAVYMFT